MVLLVVSGVNQENLFGNIINGTFVTFLSVFISIRYNRSVEAEFRDREIISMQYKKSRKQMTSCMRWLLPISLRACITGVT